MYNTYIRVVTSSAFPCGRGAGGVTAVAVSNRMDIVVKRYLRRAAYMTSLLHLRHPHRAVRALLARSLHRPSHQTVLSELPAAGLSATDFSLPGVGIDGK